MFDNVVIEYDLAECWCDYNVNPNDYVGYKWVEGFAKRWIKMRIMQFMFYSWEG